MKNLILALSVLCTWTLTFADDSFYLERNGTMYLCQADGQVQPRVVAIECECNEVSQNCQIATSLERIVSMSDGTVTRTRIGTYTCYNSDIARCNEDAAKMPECRFQGLNFSQK